MERLLERVVERAALLNQPDCVRGAAVKRVAQAAAEFGHSRQRKWVQQSGLDRQDEGHLVGEAQRCMLRLVEDRADACAAGQLMVRTRASGMPPKRVNSSSSRNCA